MADTKASHCVNTRFCEPILSLRPLPGCHPDSVEARCYSLNHTCFRQTHLNEPADCVSLQVETNHPGQYIVNWQSQGCSVIMRESLHCHSELTSGLQVCSHLMWQCHSEDANTGTWMNKKPHSGVSTLTFPRGTVVEHVGCLSRFLTPNTTFLKSYPHLLGLIKCGTHSNYHMLGHWVPLAPFYIKGGRFRGEGRLLTAGMQKSWKQNKEAPR